jgi:hypothetical protein
LAALAKVSQPFALALASASADKSKARTVRPAFTRFAAIQPPMLPRPMNAIFIDPSAGQNL